MNEADGPRMGSVEELGNECRTEVNREKRCLTTLTITAPSNSCVWIVLIEIPESAPARVVIPKSPTHTSAKWGPLFSPWRAKNPFDSR